jgi:hypothetical protein
LGRSPISDLKGFCAFASITNLLEDPEEREPANQRRVSWWVMQHGIVLSFHDSVEREQLVPTGSPVDFVSARYELGS